MKVGDLVRNIHTVIGGPLDERGIVIEIQTSKWSDNSALGAYFVLVAWIPLLLTGEYESWMDSDDLEVIA
jgi:hypothetical protein